MKKRALLTLLCFMMCGCGKQETIQEAAPTQESVEDAEERTEPTQEAVEDAEEKAEPDQTEEDKTEDAVSEDTAAVSEDAVEEKTGWGTTPDYFPPEYDPGVPEDPRPPQKEITYAVLSVYNVYENILFSVASNPSAFDTLHGTTVNGRKQQDFEADGLLVDRVSTCSDFGDFYSAAYDIHRNHMESETFYIKEDGCSVNNELSEYCMNYYDTLFSVKTDQFEQIAMSYNDSVILSGQVGDFEIFLFPLADENVKWAGYEQITIAGNTKAPVEIVVELEEHAFHVTCDSDIEMSVDGFVKGESIHKDTGIVKEFQMEF